MTRAFALVTLRLAQDGQLPHQRLAAQLVEDTVYDTDHPERADDDRQERMVQRLLDDVRRAGRIETDDIVEQVSLRGLSWLLDDDPETALELLTRPLRRRRRPVALAQPGPPDAAIRRRRRGRGRPGDHPGRRGRRARATARPARRTRPHRAGRPRRRAPHWCAGRGDHARPPRRACGGGVAGTGVPPTDPSEVRYIEGEPVNNAVPLSVMRPLWNRRCYWCNEPTSFRYMAVDHIIPRKVTAERLDELKTKFGLPADFEVHRPANLAPICTPCNTKKGSTDYGHLPALLDHLRRAATVAPQVIKRAPSFWSLDDLGPALLKVLNADLDDPEIHAFLFSYAPDLLDTAAALNPEAIGDVVARRTELELGLDNGGLITRGSRWTGFSTIYTVTMTRQGRAAARAGASINTGQGRKRLSVSARGKSWPCCAAPA